MKEDNIKLLKSILSNTKNHVSAEDLASKLHTSTRTIRNYIREINRADMSVPLILSSPAGYYRNPKAEKFDAMYLLKKPSPQVPKERLDYIIRQLLFNERISITELLLDLSVSDRTLKEDLLKLKTITKSFDLQIHQQKETLFIAGKEIDKRRFSIYCIKNTMQTELFTYKFLAIAFPEFDISFIKNTIHNILETYSLFLNGYSFYDLLAEISIQLYRISMGNSISCREFSIPDMPLYPDYYAALDIAAQFHKAFGHAYNEEEISYICGILISKTILPDQVDEWDTPEFRQLHEKVLSFLETINKYYHLDFTRNNFPVHLTHHFGRMLVRLELKLFFYLPSIMKLHNTCPILYDIAANMINDIIYEYSADFKQKEVAFLVLLLLRHMENDLLTRPKLSCTLVFPVYGNTAITLLADINAHFGKYLEITKVLSFPDMDDIDENSEIIFSAVPIDTLPNIVYISPFLTLEDYNAIGSRIYRCYMKKDLRKLHGLLVKFLSPDHFEINCRFHSSDEAIHYMCNKLKDQNYVDEHFESHVMQREKLSGTAFLNTIALPHSTRKDAQKTALYVIINDSHLQWGNEKISVIVLIAVSQKESRDFHVLYDLLAKIFSDARNAKELVAAGDYDSFMNKIEQLGGAQNSDV